MVAYPPMLREDLRPRLTEIPEKTPPSPVKNDQIHTPTKFSNLDISSLRDSLSMAHKIPQGFSIVKRGNFPSITFTAGRIEVHP